MFTYTRYFATILIAFSMVLPSVVFAAYPSITTSGVLAFTNAERYKAGLPLLDSNAQLSRAAHTKMQDLFARQYFAHEAPTGEDVSDLVDDVGYRYISVGENLALGDFVSNKDVVEAWMDSPGHRANILSTKYAEIGIAAGKSQYKGRPSWVVVQTFALPRSSCPALDVELKASVRSAESTLQALETIATMRRAQLDDRDVRRSVYTDRVASYNRVVEIYNKQVELYRTKIALYNDMVDDFNSCVKARTS